MEMNEIFDNVCQVIEKSIGKPKGSIKLEDTLFDSLGLDSIDLVDILFELETLYGVELKVNDIEHRIREELGEVPYEVNGIITKEGLDMIRQEMPELDPESIQEGLSVHRLIQLFSVQSLCKIVQYRIES